MLCLLNAAPAQAQGPVWSATLTVGTGTSSVVGVTIGCRGVAACNTALTSNSFTVGSSSYSFQHIEYYSSGALSGQLTVTFVQSTLGDDLKALNFCIGTNAFALSAATNNFEAWPNANLGWSIGDTVELSIGSSCAPPTPPTPEAKLIVSPNPVPEGRSFSVTVQLSDRPQDTVRIPVILSRGTLEDRDLDIINQDPYWQTLTYDFYVHSSGPVWELKNIYASRDSDTEDERFTVAIDTANLPSGVRAGSPTSVTVTIKDLDLDEPPRPAVSLQVLPNPVAEGSSVSVTAIVHPSLGHAVTIPLTVTRGTSEAGDHGTLAGITVPANACCGTGSITTTADTDTEDETFTVALGTLPDSLRAGSRSSVEVTISENRGGTNPGGGGGGFGGGGGGGGPSPPTGGGEHPPGSDGEPPREDEEPSTSCPQEDREILRSFYEMTDGENWDEKEYWNSEEPLGEWYGVDTEDGSVVSLRLSDNGLSGDMPREELRCLTELVELALWGNDDLTGEVPEELALAVERAALREIAEMNNINPQWFEDYGDPYDFEDWHEGVTMDDDGRVIELDLTEEGVIGEIPESVSELRRLRDIMRTTSSGGCALSPEDSSAFGLFLLTLLVFAALGRRARG